MKKVLHNIYIALLILLPIVGFALIGVGAEKDNDRILSIGIILYPIFGILLSPKMVKIAKKELASLTNHYNLTNKFHEKNLELVENSEVYNSKIIFKTITNAIFCVLLLIVVMILFFNISGDNLSDEGHLRLENRPIAFKMVRTTNKVEGGSALTFFSIMLFGIPAIVYAITYLSGKIRPVLKKKYKAYKAKVEYVDQDGDIHIISNKSRDSFDNYKLVGIRKKNIVEKDVIVVFTIDETYLFPAE